MIVTLTILSEHVLTNNTFISIPLLILETAFLKTPDLDLRECSYAVKQELLWTVYWLGTH